MNIDTVRKVLRLFFTIHDITDSEGNLHLEENPYDDNYFRWNKKSFKHGMKYTVIYNNLGVKIFDTQKVRERLGANMDKVKENPTRTLFAVNFNIVKDLILNVGVEPLTTEDKMEMEEFRREAIELREKRRKDWERAHCTCEVPDKRSKIVDVNNTFEYCIKCNKAI